MKLKVSHRIVTEFEPSRRRLVQSCRLQPSLCASQKVLNWSVSISDGETGTAFTDGAGDRTLTFSTPAELESVTVTVEGTVETCDTMGVLRDHRERVPHHAYLTSTRMVRPDAAITALAREAVAGIAADKVLDRAHALSKAVTEAMTRAPAAEEAAEPEAAPEAEADADADSDTDADAGAGEGAGAPVQMTAAEALEAGAGRSSDLAHVLIAAAHSVDLPARFVYGYFAREAIAYRDCSAAGEDAGPFVSAVWPGHAWAEIWVDGFGWIGFDPVEECCPDQRYIRLCSGRDGIDAAPLRGFAHGNSERAFDVSLDVTAADQ